MRRIGFISDVHSNLEALERTFEELRGCEVVCLGDIVGYGGSPNEVIQLLKRVNAVAIRGNHDEAVVSGDTSWFNPIAAIAAGWTTDNLSGESMAYLRGLPLQIRSEFDGLSAFLTHGSPDDNLHEYVEPETHSDLFPRYLEELGVGLVGLGHTHRPFVWKSERGQVFNPGSVGQPRDGDPRASFALATFDDGAADIQLKRVEYDIESAAAKITRSGLPEPLAARLFEGR
ncbi:MAG TPA: metallophosphoesterase family protein [Nitrososphaerales archaeon]|nr:metallophosphoesterase family protein [Nitrososphaerales archaeon]